MSQHFHAFFNAWVFFTRLPAPPGVHFSDDHLNRGSRYFSWIGMMLGALLAGTILLFNQLLPWSIAVLLMLVFSLLLTGAFHEDGLADLLDGFGGGFDRESALSIMKDSRLGTYGASALFMSLVLRWQLLVFLFEAGVSPWLVLPLVHASSRFWSISTLWSLPYVSDAVQAKSKPLATRFGWQASLIAAIPVAASFLLLPWPMALLFVVSALLLRNLLIRWFQRRIQGYTGDALGGAQQLQELLMLTLWLAWL
ncbi:MAG: adenosylcobinamide-GDP ribazoletransferase [Saccharospirillum sp.]|nr:adenosylcobinamide-GDP ribazoletransferase [Saccharospirillum sp.]